MCQIFLKIKIKMAKRLTKSIKNNIMMLRGYPLNAPDHAQKTGDGHVCVAFLRGVQASQKANSDKAKSEYRGTLPKEPDRAGRVADRIKKHYAERISAKLRKELLL